MNLTLKKLTALLLCACIITTTLCTSIFATDASARDLTQEESLAGVLKTLGLFKGVSDTNFDLGRVPTRTEALVMLVRLLDKEADALNGTWSHPFTDVAAWAAPYVGYAYQNGLTNGVSATEFGTGNASAAMYITFVLRALGYTDKDGQDFTWDDPYTLAIKSGIIPQNADLENFWRADVVLVSYAALNANLKDSEQTLASKLWTGDEYAAFEQQYSADAIQLKLTPFNTLVQYAQANGEYDKKKDRYILKKDASLTIEYYLKNSQMIWQYTPKVTWLGQSLGDITLTLTLYNSNGEYAFLIEIPSQDLSDDGVLFADKFGGIFDTSDTLWRTTDSDGRTNPRLSAMLFDGIADAVHELISENQIAASIKDFGFTYID